MRKTKVLKTKPVYLTKIQNCVIQIKIKDCFEGIKDNVEKRFEEIPCLISRRIWGGQGQS